MSLMRTKSYKFVLEAIFLSKELIEKKEFILSKQFLRSGTSIGANIREAGSAQTKPDFIYKLSISQKECDETLYWLELLRDSQYINEGQYEHLSNQATELLRMLKSSIITAKGNLKK
jgi:four helix bundle protein